MNKKKVISIGIVCFNEELNVTPAYKELSRVANINKRYTFEFIFADNGSTDNTQTKIKKIIQKDSRVSGIFLSRNFGPEATTQASFDYAKGDAFICYECDMEDPPDLITDLIKQWEKGFKVVIGIRRKKDDNFYMRRIRKLYYRIFKAISNIEIPVDAGHFGLLDKQVIDAIRKLPEKYRFYRGLRAWVGFKASYIKYERKKRMRGKSSYNLLSYIHHAERSFFGFSYLPLDIIVYIGILLVLLSFIWIIAFLFPVFFLGQSLKESTLTLISIVLFGGIQILALSIIGKYIQVIVEETKARPTYIVEEVFKNNRSKL